MNLKENQNQKVNQNKLKLNQDIAESKKLQELNQDLKRDHTNNKSKVVTLVIIMISVLFICINIWINIFSEYKKDEVNLNDNQIAYVNGEIITYDEYIMHLKTGISYYEEEAGKDIWNINSNNMNMFEILKKRILDELITIKVQVLNAKKLQIVTNSDMSETEIAGELRKYIDSQYVLNAEDFNKYISDNNIADSEIENERIQYENMIKQRIYDEYLDKIISEIKGTVIINSELYNSILKEEYIKE